MNKRQRLQSALVSQIGRKADIDTREQIFRCVASNAKNAPRTVQAMVSKLAKNGNQVSAVTVNNHLRSMRDLNLCKVVGSASQGRGRAGAVWGLTEKGQELALLR